MNHNTSHITGHAEAELKYGKDPRTYQVMTRRFVGDGQKLTGVEIVGVKMEKDAQTGQFRPTEVSVFLCHAMNGRHSARHRHTQMQPHTLE